jgi:DNA-binding MarR family transcriptional regulator
MEIVREMRQTSLSRYDVGCALFDGFRRWGRLAERNLSAVGLGLAELRVLVMLAGVGPCSMVTLAKEQEMTAPGMTIVVDKLEEAGLARRVRSDADRRTINVAITGKGGETLRRARKLHDRFVERCVHDASSQEIESFLVFLNRMVVAAEGFER